MILRIAAFCLFIFADSSYAAWLSGWTYRALVTESNNQGTNLANYPKEIILNSSCVSQPAACVVFTGSFSNIKSDCSDLRVTDTDGQTIIPYTVLVCTPGSSYVDVWFVPANLPGSGTYTPYLYWGNVTPPSFQVPPLGPWVKSGSNPVISNANNNIPENTVFDTVTNEYWMTIGGGAGSGIRLAFSTDLMTWTDNGAITLSGSPSSGVTPHLMIVGGTYYMYFTDSGFSHIYYATASSITGTYTVGSSLLTTGSGWKSMRVGEEFVYPFNGTYYMFYMGDTDTGSGENVGYATSSSPAGPFTDYASNPLITFGASKTYDAGTVADPSVININGIWYISYVCSVVTGPWNDCLATSPDLVSVTKYPMPQVLRGAGSTWDNFDAFRGGINQFGNTYLQVYGGNQSGGNHSVGLSTQSSLSTAAGYPPQQIFHFFEPFASYNQEQWINPTGFTNGTTTVSANVMALANNSSGNEGVYSFFRDDIGTVGLIYEFNSQRTNVGANFAGEVGPNSGITGSQCGQGTMDRLLDNAGAWKAVNDSGTLTNLTSAPTPDTSYHINAVWRNTSSDVKYKFDTNSSVGWTDINSNAITGVAAVCMYSFGSSVANQLNVGQASGHTPWGVRVRPYSEPEPSISLGAVQVFAFRHRVVSE